MVDLLAVLLHYIVLTTYLSICPNIYTTNQETALPNSLCGEQLGRCPFLLQLTRVEVITFRAD